MDVPQQKLILKNSIQSDLNLPRMKIKQETNLYSDGLPGGRLASLKLPRDLSLGGSMKIPKDVSGKKKIYTPNLNITRNKTSNKSVVELSVSNRKRGRESSITKNRVKPTSNLIQSKGVFSEGTAQTFNKRSGYHSERNHFEDEASGSKTKPTLNKKCDLKIDKMQEKMLIDELLKDDFDPSTDVENEVSPVDLPFIKKPKLKIKEEFQNSIKTESGSVEYIIQEQHNFFLFQFPDSLPGRGQDIETPVESKGVKYFPRNRCTVNDLSEGLLGKIIIRKSGVSKFVIGDLELNLEAGVPPVYQQNVVSAPVANENTKHKMINMGPILGSLVTFPDWFTLLEQTNAISNQSSPYSPQ